MPQGCGCGSGGSGGTGSCSDVAACVAGMVSATPCLDVTGGVGSEQLTPVISNQPGNLLSCTSEGFYVAGEVTPTFCSPPPLPTPFYLANTQGPYAPWGSRDYLDVCLDHDVDGIWGFTWPAPDGPFIWGINSAASTSTRYFGIGYQTRVWQPPVDPTGRIGEIHSQTWTNLISPAGNTSGLIPNNGVDLTFDPDSVDTDDGGWWGWGASPYSGLTLREALDHNACRMRFFTNMEGTTIHTGSSNIANRFIAEMADSPYGPVVVPCINYSLVSANAIYNNNGFQTAALVTAGFTGTGQDLVDDGFTYAIVNPDAINPAIVESIFTTPGLIGIANQGMSRHYKTAANLAAGAQGIIAHDPVYARGHTGAEADTYYEQRRLHYDYNRTIGSSSDRGDVNAGNAYSGRPGRFLYMPAPTSTDTSRQRELLLPLDIPDPTNWEMNWTQAWSVPRLSSSIGQGVGIFWGNTTDVTTWGPRANSTELAMLNGYFCTVIVSLTAQRGYMYIIKYANGVGSELYRQDKNLTASAGYLHMGLQVTPSSFNFLAYDDDWSTIASQTINDPDYRGKYVWGIVYSGISATGGAMNVRWTNVNIGAPVAAGLLAAESGASTFAAAGGEVPVAGDIAEGDGTAGLDYVEGIPLVAPVNPNPIFNEPRPNPTPGL
jgi:hypothetical protein